MNETLLSPETLSVENYYIPTRRFAEYFKHFLDLVEKKIEFPEAAEAINQRKSEELIHLVEFCIANSRDAKKRPLPFSYCISESWHIGASIRPGDHSNRICLNKGLLWALEDIFLRLTANKDFFSHDSSDTRLWPGCDCIWTHGFGKITPKTRYTDYTPTEIQKNQIQGTILSHHFESLPTDIERMNLTALLMAIATTYVIIHEETHYDAGHIAFMNSRGNFSILNEAERNLPELSGELMRTMEWEADYHASRAIFLIYHSSSYHQMLPSYCQIDPESWMQRVIIIAISSLNIALQKVRITNGSDNLHPHPRTRLISSTYQMAGIAYESSPKTSLNVMKSAALSIQDIRIASELLSLDGPMTHRDENDGFPVRQKSKPLNIFADDHEMVGFAKYFIEKSSGTESNLAETEKSIIHKLWFEEFESLIEKQKKLHVQLKDFRKDIGVIE